MSLQSLGESEGSVHQTWAPVFVADHVRSRPHSLATILIQPPTEHLSITRLYSLPDITLAYPILMLKWSGGERPSSEQASPPVTLAAFSTATPARYGGRHK